MQGMGKVPMAKESAAKKSVGRYPQEFRAKAVERMRTCFHIGQLAEELGVSRWTLTNWRKQLMEAKKERSVSAAARWPETYEEENRRLKRALAEKVLEVDFFKGALQKIEARRQPNVGSGAKASTTRSGE